MNKDILQSKRRELRGLVKDTWGKLTDDDLDRIEGQVERLVGLRQQRYGYAKEKAEEGYTRIVEQWIGKGGSLDMGHPRPDDDHWAKHKTAGRESERPDSARPGA